MRPVLRFPQVTVKKRPLVDYIYDQCLHSNIVYGCNVLSPELTEIIFITMELEKMLLKANYINIKTLWNTKVKETHTQLNFLWDQKISHTLLSQRSASCFTEKYNI